jgi:hypothetical protein
LPYVVHGFKPSHDSTNKHNDFEIKFV